MIGTGSHNPSLLAMLPLKFSKMSSKVTLRAGCGKGFLKILSNYVNNISNYVKAIAKVVKSATPFQQKEDMKLA